MNTQKPVEIIMLEEDRALADLILMALEREGFRAAVVSRPADLWAVLEALQPRLVILDLFLTGHSGLELLQEMKEKGWLDQTRVLVVSSLGFREVVKQATQLGAIDFIVKPFDIDAFLQRVQKCLQSRAPINLD
jgi:DNA-binding response OmpR family regulator